MTDVAKEIADIERELLALTADQPPNPNQIQIYTVTMNTTTNPQLVSIIFDDGIIRPTRAFTDPGDYVNMLYTGGVMKVFVGGTVPCNFTVVSMGSFTLV